MSKRQKPGKISSGKGSGRVRTRCKERGEGEAWGACLAKVSSVKMRGRGQGSAYVSAALLSVVAPCTLPSAGMRRGEEEERRGGEERRREEEERRGEEKRRVEWRLRAKGGKGRGKEARVQNCGRQEEEINGGDKERR